MNLTQILAIATLGTALSLSLLQDNSVQAATVTFNISASNASGYFSFDDSNISLGQGAGSSSATSLTDFNLQIDGETYILSDLGSFGGPNTGLGVYFPTFVNRNTGFLQPILSNPSLFAYGAKDNTSLLINRVLNGMGPASASFYQFSRNSALVDSGVLFYTQRPVPEPDFTAGIAVGVGVIGLGWLKNKRLRNGFSK